MGFCFKLWAFIGTLLLDSIANGFQIDLCKTRFPDSIQVAVGNFNNLGIYRLLHLKSPAHVTIMHGDVFISAPGLKLAPISEVFIEEFRRGSRLFIAVTYIAHSNDYAEHVYVEKRGKYIYECTGEEKNAFVNGPVRIRTDIMFINHSVIDTKVVVGHVKPWVWLSIGNKADDETGLLHSRLWKDGTTYLMSPIVQIDSMSRNLDGPGASLIGRITAFHQYSNEQIITVKLDKTGDREFILIIGPIEKDIFTPMNLSAYPHMVGIPIAKPVTIRQHDVDIDISRTMLPPYDVVILSNLRRGDWLYSQHTILPIRKMEDLNTRVWDAYSMVEIYKVCDEEVITHVEVFQYAVKPLKYVVVHTRKLTDIHSPGSMLFYKFNNKYDSPSYDLLSDEMSDECHKMLYNIVTTMEDVTKRQSHKL
ncbi:spherical body protein, putative [Babesia ovis]|uniref:Spherical body protein, putative n=1 Tax=Babesia ovis TaxID=5869 RepID=A0A9W5TCW7_BABOV|nr:spherical body protein, putative [Babesia ovis]